jgi:hypothetical protein
VVLRCSKTKAWEEHTYHDEVEAVLGVEFSECTDGAHLVWLEALRVRARVVLLDHARADIDTYKARNVWRERTRNLSYGYAV